jgi:hypothetical protein
MRQNKILEPDLDDFSKLRLQWLCYSVLSSPRLIFLALCGTSAAAAAAAANANLAIAGCYWYVLE